MVAGLLAVQVATNSINMSRMAGGYGAPPPPKRPKMKWYTKLIWGIVFGVLIACVIDLVIG